MSGVRGLLRRRPCRRHPAQRALLRCQVFKILLRKCVPDLAAAEIKADIRHRYVIEVPPPLSEEEWLEKYGGSSMPEIALKQIRQRRRSVVAAEQSPATIAAGMSGVRGLLRRRSSPLFRSQRALLRCQVFKILLRKCVPDLAAAEIKADIRHRYVIEVPPPLSEEEWLEKYGG